MQICEDIYKNLFWAWEMEQEKKKEKKEKEKSRSMYPQWRAGWRSKWEATDEWLSKQNVQFQAKHITAVHIPGVAHQQCMVESQNHRIIE